MAKQQKLTLSIPQPCHENWDAMTPNERGKHCTSCDKTVIDFSLYSDRQLVDFFKHTTGNICAHIPAYNLNREISVVDLPNRSFWHKLFFGTALASWLGLATKADAQTKATPHPVVMQNNHDITTGKVTQAVQDTSNNYVQFTFVDSASKKAVPQVDITITGENFTRYYSTNKSTYKAYIPQEQVGKTLTFTFVTYEYGAREIQITTQKLPMRKKILLQFVGPKVMVNGGLGFRYEEKK